MYNLLHALTRNSVHGRKCKLCRSRCADSSTLLPPLPLRPYILHNALASTTINVSTAFLSVLHRVVDKCSDVSEEYTGSIFRITGATLLQEVGTLIRGAETQDTTSPSTTAVKTRKFISSVFVLETTKFVFVTDHKIKRSSGDKNPFTFENNEDVSFTVMQ